MASRLKKLQDSQAAVLAEMRSMLDKCEKENRQLGAGEANGEETKTYATLEARAAENQAGLDIELKLQEQEKRLATIPDMAAPLPEEREAAADNGSPQQAIERRVANFAVPAATPRYGKLKHFENDKDAYFAGQWFRAILFGNQQAARFCVDHGIPIFRGDFTDYDRGEWRTAQGGATNSIGGFLVPDLLERTIINLRETYGVFRQNAKIIPMGSDTVNIPRRLTGLTAAFYAENIEIIESNKTWDQVSLVAKKLGALTKWSSELDQDAVISIADDLASEIAYAFALKEDQSGFIGDGSATYGTITGIAVAIDDGTHTASIATAATGHTAFSSLTLSDFHAVTGLLPLYATPNAKWYVSKAGFAASMERLEYAGGGNTVQTIGGGSGPSFLGYPVVFSQVLNTTLAADISKIKVLFGDLMLSSAMGVRRGVTIATSSERFFEFDQLAIRGTERFDIKNHDMGSTTVPGPMVALKTPAS